MTVQTERKPVQARILDAAVELFAEKGFDGTSVQEIVERAEVTKGALYHYFASKYDLLYEIYHTLIAVQLGELDRILALKLPPDQTIRAVIVSLVETTAARISEAAVFSHEMARLDPVRMAAVKADRRRYHDGVRALVAEGQASGAFAPVASADTVTYTVFGVINQMPRWYRPDGRKPPRQFAEELADFVLAALEIRQEATSSGWGASGE